MTKLEELKATAMAKLDAAADAAVDTANADGGAARDAADAAYAAWEDYEAELKKQENGAMSKFEALKQTRDAKTNRRRTMNMLGLTGEEQ
jgi:hypothetical protein